MALAPDAPAAKRVAFRAGKQGDSVAAVARRYRVSPAQVAQWNQVGASAQFAAGSTVVVFVAARSAKAAPVRTAAGKQTVVAKKLAAHKPAAKRSAKATRVAAAPSATVKR